MDKHKHKHRIYYNEIVGIKLEYIVSFSIQVLPPKEEISDPF